MASITSLSVIVRPDVPACEVGSGVVWLRGEHDLSTVPELSAALTGLITRDAADVVVDMAEVRFMDAAIVGVLLRARALLHMRSRCLVLRSPSRCVRRVLELCGDADLLVVSDPRDDELTPAMAGLGAS